MSHQGNLQSSFTGVLVIAICASALLSQTPAEADDSSFAKVVASAQPKLVKIYGASGFRGLESYQSGFLISPSGHVLTAWTLALDADEIVVVLNDGEKLVAELVGVDPRLDVALLKVDGEQLPYFDLQELMSLDRDSLVALRRKRTQEM